MAYYDSEDQGSYEYDYLLEDLVKERFKIAINSEIHVLRGTAYWAKILGKPSPGYKGKGLFWNMDLAPDSLPEAAAKMGKDKIKNKDDDRGRFVSFKQEYKQLIGKDGEPYMTSPPKIFDIKGQKWPEDKKIGNGSKVDVKFSVVDYGDDKVGVYIKAVRVLKYIPYEAGEFSPVDEEDEFFDEDSPVEASPVKANEVSAEPIPEPEPKKTRKAKIVVDDDFDDEIPF